MRKKKLKLDYGAIIYGASIGIALILIYNQLSTWMFFSWMYNPYINYGILIPLVCAFLAYRKRDLLKRMRDDRGLLLVAIAVVLLFHNSLYVHALSLLLMITGMAVFFFNLDILKKFWFEISYLVFMIPIPEHITELIGLYLKQLSINASLWLSSFFTQASIELDYIVVNGSYVLQYGMECSGLESFLAFTVFAILFVRLFDNKLWRSLTVVVLSPIAAIVLNILRITLLIAVAPIQGGMLTFLFHLTAGPTMVAIYGTILLMVYRGVIWKKR
jgi:exosortase